MAGSLGRLAAALLLLLQLQPAALPVLCELPNREPAAACGQPMAPEPAGPAVGAPSQQHPCANPALCGVPATAVAIAPAVPLAVTDLESGVAFVLDPMRSGDAPAPLSPPPQA